MTDLAQDRPLGEPAATGRLDRLTRLLAPPVAVLGQRGTIITPLIVVFSVSLLASGAALAWADAAGPQSTAPLLRASPYLVWVLALLSPVAAAFKGTLFAAMAWGILALLGGTPRLRPVLSALFYGEAILSLQVLWVTVGALLLDRPPSVSGAFPVPSGLDAFVGAQGGALLAVAQQVTPFHVAWGIFLTLAFTAHGGVSRWGGAGAALFLWCLGAALAALRIPTP